MRAAVPIKVTGVQRAQSRFRLALSAGLQRCGSIPQIEPRQFKQRATRKAAKLQATRDRIARLFSPQGRADIEAASVVRKAPKKRLPRPASKRRRPYVESIHFGNKGRPINSISNLQHALNARRHEPTT